MREHGNRATRMRRVGVAVVTGWAALTAALVPATAATAATAAGSSLPVPETVVSLELPGTAESAWVELEQAGLSADDVSIETATNDDDWLVLAVTPTTFGLHGEIETDGSEALRVRVRLLGDTAGIRPDLAVTGFDAAGTVVAAHDERLDLEAEPSSPGTPSSPGAPEPAPTGQPGEGSDPGSGSAPSTEVSTAPDGGSSVLGATGLAAAPWAIAAVLLVAGGVAVVLVRRRRGGAR
ncbi:hypothetical protein N1031_18980 [Herbiconiux moechotypicola]|nr:hypothetical protein [Herbiconiux moechotypicola]MCS5731845.1 hypothetical protein [Herbiconiux moechotypicola]